jgi:hypothetical protein
MHSTCSNFKERNHPHFKKPNHNLTEPERGYWSPLNQIFMKQRTKAFQLAFILVIIIHYIQLSKEYEG